MQEIIPTSYNFGLVIFSFVIAALGSYIALSATDKLRSTQGIKHTRQILMAGIALGGIGVWSMHFIGMLSLQLPLGISYSIGETIISLIAAIAASAWGLSIVAVNPKSWVRLLIAGAILGLGVSAMHYVGMYGMRFGGFFLWSAPLVLLSVLIAFIAATAALWLAFNTPTSHARLWAALLMAVAVCAMHYTGMTAAEIICTTTERLAIPSGATMISSLQLPILVISLIAGMIIAIGIDVMYNPHTQKRREMA